MICASVYKVIDNYLRLKVNVIQVILDRAAINIFLTLDYSFIALKFINYAYKCNTDYTNTYKIEINAF